MKNNTTDSVQKRQSGVPWWLLSLFGATILLLLGCPDSSGGDTTPPEDTTPPAAVSGFVAAIGDGQVILSWTNPADSDFDHIEITWTPANNGGIKILSAAESGNAGASASAMITGLTNGTEYMFTIIAVDTNGNKSETQTAMAIPNIPDDTSPSAVSAVTVDTTGDTQITLSWTNPADIDFDHIEITWTPTDNGGMQILSAAESGSAGASASTTITGLTNDTEYMFTVVAVDTSGNKSIDNPSTSATLEADDDNDGVVNSADVDDNNDGLIEIYNLNMLNSMRYNLEGSSYKESSTASATTLGASEAEPSACADGDAMTTIVLCGYELARSLDFADTQSYAGGLIIDDWRPNSSDPDMATNNGWPPIGNNTNSFSAIFTGKGYTITNLYVRNGSENRVGLFGQTASNASIRAVGIIDNAVYAGAVSDNKFIGALVGRNVGTIHASYATGNAAGAGNSDFVGGLVGYNQGTIYASYATGNAAGAEDNDSVGGLVGNNQDTIYASYATGNVDGGAGTNDFVGGLVGNNQDTIYASYATGNVDGGAGTIDIVGTLAGVSPDMVTASYASGMVTGGEFSGSAGSDPDATLALLQSSTNSNVAESTPFYRWAVVPDGTDDGALPDWIPSTAAEKLAVYCDSDFSGSIETAEEMADNYVWDFGNDSDLPRITCIPTP